MTRTPSSAGAGAGGTDWQRTPLSPTQPLGVHRTPLRYFADRLRRLQPFSFARLDGAFAAPDDTLTASDDALAPPDDALARDVEARLRELSAADPGWFVGADAGDASAPDEGGSELSARIASALPSGCVAQDGALFRRATINGKIRGLYAALRPYHLVAVGPARLGELGERLRPASFRLDAVDAREAAPQRHDRLARIREDHARFHGEPVVYLFHAGPTAAWWTLELHGRLRNAFLMDLGTALEACIPGRVLGAPASGWGPIHWQAVARHLGIDPGRSARSLSSWESRPPPPNAAPGRVRPALRAPAIERRRARRPDATAGWARPEAETAWERFETGDVERRLAEVIAPPIPESPSAPSGTESPSAPSGA